MRGARSTSVWPRRRLSAMTALVLWILSGALPSVLLFVVAAAHGARLSTPLVGALAVASLTWLAIVALRVRASIQRHSRRLNNLVEAARAQDYMIRAAVGPETGELAELYRQINALINDLESGRHAEQELLAMLRKVVGQIRVAIVVCDAQDRLRMVNPAAAALLGVAPEALIGASFADTPLAELPLSAEPKIIDHAFSGVESRWQVSQLWYRHQGRPSRIVFIVDVRQVLVDEEILMWQRLIRVIGHEVNNSLAPISSLCQTLETLLARGDSEARQAAIREGLQVIGQRARGLQEFISVYSRIARLPDPDKLLFPVRHLVDRVRGMFPEGALAPSGDVPDVRLYGDPIHLEQALINLIKNALEANAGSDEPVVFHVRVREASCEFEVADAGPGIANPGNLFVPFYTTKTEGAGIGLVLSRNIVAKHHGQLTLENRGGRSGAVARMTLPLPPPEA